MGAPVITKAGHSYVSRMSTAVLEGCGLQDWVAADEQPMCHWLLSRLQILISLRAKRDNGVSANSNQSTW